MATYDIASLEKIANGYAEGQEYLADVSIDINPQENNVDPLDLLRLYQSERTIDNGLKLAVLFCVNKKVTVSHKEETLLEFTPVAGKPFQTYLEEAPYLLDILCSTMWGILLKKLTPPSTGSKTAGGESLL